ncbi:PREDICTED: putative late blight resistance protein homolog R1A-10 [Erythranthe guttata]|uniref:putative late blight resistance protein homolog R1A-10 n=1 Tax=Erythranthe guttata TaxID=4155 RepID=UPI00064D8FB2|nr:PREDICTED: putative late blight resistance protein homolog R1A-10 [Erythranthe guttata]|eukprot:XP_012853218.1 PREDICTED: putative late blight resistance protein homolog R1A-10 [Erythranthe guttata]
MAAAYAALVSLTHTLDQILLHPPPTLDIIFDTDQIQSLRDKAEYFLVDFFENYTSSGGNKEMEDLETMIGDAAYAAEYIVEFNVMNQILGRSSADREESSNLLFEGVEISIQEFLFIEKELVKFKKDMQRPNNYYLTTKASSSSSSRPLLPACGKNSMVGFDNHMDEIMGALSTNESNLRIISIVGMGGIGKTTLATNVFNNPFIVEHFQLRAWFTVSQEYTDKKILLGLLHQISNTYRNAYEIDDDDDDDEDDDYEIGDRLHKTLFGRKYLIVMDDMWDIKAWDMVKRFLPDNSNGSRIFVTTRLMKLAVDIGSCSPYQLNLLEKSQSWDLLREKIFAEERCPDELEGTGKSIATKCRGLPLALVVIAGVLAKSKTKQHWVSIEKDVTSVVNNEDDEFCMKILLLSYNNLPIHLKPCFLYFAVFPEDHIIKAERLVRLWVAEGFIRQYGHKSLEEIGKEYLKDLIDRNLISVNWRSVTGEVTGCNIHDVLSNLCKREAQKDNFILSFARKLYNPDILTFMKFTPRLSINDGKWKGTKHKPYTSQIPTRSLLCFSKGASTDYTARRFPLLRVLDVVDIYPKDEILQLINSSCCGEIVFPSSLKELILSECKIPWEDMSVVGSLPNLQVLELHKNAAIGKKWIPKEGEFIRLKFLWINMCELEIWEADNTHFPCLVKLNLGYLNLKEIPLDFDEILPLRAINLYHNSSNDLRASANEISERRENLGYDALYVQKFTFGVLKIWVKRGINLAVGGGDPYVVITMGNQSVETRIVTNDVHPIWDEVLTIYVSDPSRPVSLVRFSNLR